MFHYEYENGRASHVVHVFPSDTPACKFMQFDVEKNEMYFLADGFHSPPHKRLRKNSREPRKTEIKIIFSDPVSVTKIRIPLKAGDMQIIGRPQSVLYLQDSFLTPVEVEMICYYDRKCKRKIINAFFFNNACPPANTNVALGRYDHFYACDANTWDFKGVGKVSVSAAIRGNLRMLTDDYRKAEYMQPFMRIAENVEGNPELSAVKELIEQIQSEIKPLPVKPIGIIMDSELGILKEINARRLPILDNFFLPPGFEILYASDATGSVEFFSNMLIRMCDIAATNFLIAHQKTHGLVRV